MGATAPETTSAFFEQLQKGNYEAAAAFFDPPAVKEFRESLNIIDEAPLAAQSQFREAFFGAGATAESIAKLSDLEFFSFFLKAALGQAEALGTANFDSMEVLGEVMEGPDLAHVVTRTKVSVGEIEVEGMEVVSCRKRGDEWKLLLSGETSRDRR